MQVNEASAQRPNPRRTPAHRSVSLRHGLLHPHQHSHLQDFQRTSEVSSLNNRDSSGETSNAENWFAAANERLSKKSTPFADTDPPFFIENTASSESPPQCSLQNQMNLPLRSMLQQQDSVGSSSEDYRGVIDDLTIENNRLKRRLEKYDRLHDAHMRKDKLFEVKIHGLPARKKRELEETLRKFAASLHDSPACENKPTRSGSAVRTQADIPVVNKAASSMASERFADSGYGSASMSASHQASTINSGSALKRKHEQPQKTRAQSIRSYLHDIPEGLMPKHPTAMTESHRKKLVVRRLEQIFGGRGAAVGGHQQSLQQQEVSTSAANADRSALEAEGRRLSAEGIREARIMDFETEDPMDQSTMIAGSGEQQDTPMLDSNQHQDSGKDTDSLEQRPTRPLDLDPDRAQDPIQNLGYFRHLGFMEHSKDQEVPLTEGGASDWIYLNLLINTAQLHVFSVSTDFVKRAIVDCSRSLELSSDGRKVRWIGPTTDSSSSPATSDGLDSPMKSPRKRLPSNPDMLEAARATKKVALAPSVDKSAYTPLFSRQLDPDDSDASSERSSIDSNEETYASSGLATYRSSSRSHRNAGPMIFYNNASFCTDLSGDTTQTAQPYSAADYTSVTSLPLGAPKAFRPTVTRLNSSEYDGLALKAASQPLAAEDLEDPSNLDLDFPERRSPKHVTFAEPEEPFPFEASGLGGVTPKDNIAITVLRQRTLLQIAQGSTESLLRKAALPKVAALFETDRKSSPKPHVAEAIVFSRTEYVEPSPLPPAGMHFATVDEDDYDSDGSSDTSSSRASTSASSTELLRRRYTDPAATPMIRARHSSDFSAQSIASNEPEQGEVSNADIDEDDDADDQSVDFLAMARAADPDAIRAKEREYDAQMADRLADEIPAGSSAATAGGGSGFASPEVDCGVDVEEMDERSSVSS